MVYVQTPNASGSGVLIWGGYVVTCAHVTWPFDTVSVTLPDGREFPHAPVKGWDSMRDVAVIGPLEGVRGPALALGNGESLPLGSDVLLLGYPGGVETEHPQPTVVRGIISRFRESQGVTFIQADASIAGGQSGGALVSAHGRLIGISGQSFTEAQFSLSASTWDLRSTVNRMIDGEADPALGVRSLVYDEGSTEHRFTVEVSDRAPSRLRVRAFGIEVVEGATVDLSFAGDGIGVAGFYDLDGNSLLDPLPPGDKGSIEAPYHGLLAVVVYAGDGDFVLRSNRGLIPFPDPDDGVAAEVGQTLTGHLDFPGDDDVFPLRLRAGQTVEVTVRSVMGDTRLRVFGERWGQAPATDDDGASGGLGLDSVVVYRAPHAGLYHIAVDSAVRGLVPAGYTVDVRLAPDGATLTPISTPTPTPTPRPTPRPTPPPRRGSAWTYQELTSGPAVFTEAIYSNLSPLPDLAIRCAGGELDIWVAWYARLTGTRHGHTFTDASATVALEWDPSVSGEAAFHPNPRAFLRDLLQGTRLAIVADDPAFPPPGDNYYGATFDIRGLRAALQSVPGWRCGF